VRLRVAAKIDAADERYYRERIVPLMGAPVEFLGEVGEGDKPAFLGNATALLFPISWPEPFGLAMIEAMACGTPVLAWRNGSVPEVVDPGVTGFVVNSIDEAVQHIPRIGQLSRAQVRVRYEARFTASRMARDYLGIYRTLGRKHAAATMKGKAEAV